MVARLLIGALGTAVAAGWLATSGPADPSPPRAGAAAAPPTTVRPCSTRAEPSWRPSRRDLVMGSTRSALHSFATTNPSVFASRPGTDEYGQLKTPVAVKAGHTVTLTVAPEDRPYASFVFDYGRHGRQIGPYWSFRVSDGVPRVRLIACRADQPMFSGPGNVGPWTAFPGAMIVAGARCLTLEVRERGRPTLR